MELQLDDIQNATFTITDLSGFNVIDFIPVINSNQSAILGIGKQYDGFIWNNGKIEYDPKINLILTYDHRVLNGKYAALFLNELKDNIE